MTTVPRPLASGLLFCGIFMAALTEAIAGTALSLGRADIIGDTSATPDEFAWLDIGYTTFKLMAFLLAPWLATRLGLYRLVFAATLVMGLTCGLAAATIQLDCLIALRAIQGFSGGTLLVAGQTIVFLAYPSRCQPILQALYAIASVVSPATFAPALHGLLIDSYSWIWIFFIIGPVALAAIGMLMMSDAPPLDRTPTFPFDWVGCMLAAIVLFCLVYILIQGHRWDWLEESHIVWLTFIGGAAFIALFTRQAVIRCRGMLDPAPFRVEGFSFAFAVSFVAGAALYGSAYLIPAFAISVLSFTPMDAGYLLLPSGMLFICALFGAACLFQFCHVPPIATVPFGVLLIMTSMWMLSGSTSESGEADMMMAILLRGGGLGLLFLSLTLTAFSDLAALDLANGIGIFNTSRQLGGLIGIAVLQTLIDHQVAMNVMVLGSHVVAGAATVEGRLGATIDMLSGKGMEPGPAIHAAGALLDKNLIIQSTVLAFDAAFGALAILFVFAAPLLVATKVTLHRIQRR